MGLELEPQKISVPVLRRLPLYYFFLKELSKTGEDVVSAARIAEHFRFDAIKVRKDLAHTGVVGKPKVGFVVGDLLKAIEHFLGWADMDEAFLVGCGDLGSALLGYEGFANYGIDILAGFDVDPAKVGTRVHDKIILPLDKLTSLCQRMHIKIAVLTVPASAAQEVVDMLVAGGVKGIWNFSPAALRVPEDVVVQQHSMAGALAILMKKVRALGHKSSVGSGGERHNFVLDEG